MATKDWRFKPLKAGELWMIFQRKMQKKLKIYLQS